MSPTASAYGSSGTSTTARSSGSPSALLTLGRIRAASDEHAALLEVAIDELATGLQEIRELAAGLHPSVLTERGLVAALEALALRAPVPVQLQDLPDRRLPEPVEAAAYYVVAEALANVQKHAGARRVVVRAAVHADLLAVEVADDGIGGADDQGAACAASPTASKRSTAGSRWIAQREAEPG